MVTCILNFIDLVKITRRCVNLILCFSRKKKIFIPLTESLESFVEKNYNCLPRVDVTRPGEGHRKLATTSNFDHSLVHEVQYPEGSFAPVQQKNCNFL